MEEEKKSDGIEWVPMYLGYDEEAKTVKLKVDNKDDFPKAVGLLMRVSLTASKDILLNEAKEEEKNESTGSDK